MRNEFEIRKTEESTILVFTPYNAEFVKRVKATKNAKWKPSAKAWELPDFLEDEVRLIISEIYGYDENEVTNTVDVKIIVKEELREECEDVTLLGKCLCHAWGRDSGGRCSNDVAYLKETATSGGSTKHWASIVPQGAELLLHNVSEKKYLELINSEDEVLNKIEISLVEKSNDVKKKELEAEKERLLKKIEEIEKCLKEF